MKNLKSLWCLSLFLLSGTLSYGQVQAVVDAGAIALLEKTSADQVIYHYQSLMQMVENVQNTYQQVQGMIRAEERALQNLRSISDVKSFKDFMTWQNRQLYMEREAEQRFHNLGVKIGNKTYKMEEIEQIPYAAGVEMTDKWGDDFTEEERRQMYVKLGLAPSNYAYLKTWQEREEKIARKMMTMADTINDDNMEAADRDRETAEKYARANENLGEKEILMNTHMSIMELNRHFRDLQRDIAEKNAYELALRKKGETPPTPPRLSDHWDNDLYGSITDAEPGITISEE